MFGGSDFSVQQEFPVEILPGQGQSITIYYTAEDLEPALDVVEVPIPDIEKRTTSVYRERLYMEITRMKFSSKALDPSQDSRR